MTEILDDRIIWNRLIAHVMAKTHLNGSTIEDVFRSALVFVLSLEKEP